MKAYAEMSKDELLVLKSELEAAYKAFKDQGLKLNSDFILQMEHLLQQLNHLHHLMHSEAECVQEYH